MSSDPQPTYYSNAHQQQQNYYMQPNNGMDPPRRGKKTKRERLNESIVSFFKTIEYQMIRQPSQFNQQPRLAVNTCHFDFSKRLNCSFSMSMHKCQMHTEDIIQHNHL